MGVDVFEVIGIGAELVRVWISAVLPGGSRGWLRQGQRDQRRSAGLPWHWMGAGGGWHFHSRRVPLQLLQHRCQGANDCNAAQFESCCWRSVACSRISGHVPIKTLKSGHLGQGLQAPSAYFLRFSIMALRAGFSDQADAGQEWLTSPSPSGGGRFPLGGWAEGFRSNSTTWSTSRKRIESANTMVPCRMSSASELIFMGFGEQGQPERRGAAARKVQFRRAGYGRWRCFLCTSSRAQIVELGIR